MVFLVAAVALAISAGAWWMQRIVFTPDATRDTAAAMLAEPDIRQELNNVVTGATAGPLGMPAADLYDYLETEILSSRAGAAMMGPIMEQAHQRIIGNRDDDPITLTSGQLVEIVRNQRAGDLEPLTLPINPVGTLSTINMVVGWIIPIAAAVGLLALLLGIVLRPDRRDVLRGLGEFGLALAVAMVMFGYLIPVHLLTAIDNSTWTHAIPRLALRTLPVVLGSAAIFALAGAALILASMTGGKRKQWSTPLSVARYRGGDNPGWG